MALKQQAIRSQAMRDAARGEQCTFEIVGTCNHDPSTSVLCHLPDESGGAHRKTDDISSGIGCSACHDIVDRRVYNHEFEENRDWYCRRAQTRTIRRMIEKGVIHVR